MTCSEKMNALILYLSLFDASLGFDASSQLNTGGTCADRLNSLIAYFARVDDNLGLNLKSVLGV